MSRLTGSDALGLYEAYQAVYAPQELTEEQVWEEVETWVNSLLEEGYDLSDYTWEEMYESYINEDLMGDLAANAGNIKRGLSGAYQGAMRTASNVNKSITDRIQSNNKPKVSNLGPNYADQERKLSQAANRSQIGTPRQGTAGGNSGLGNISPSEGTGRGGPSDIRKTQPRTNIPPTKPAAAAPKPAASATAPKPAPAATTPAAKPSPMQQFAAANPKLAASAAERDRTRGTSATTNPLMKDMKSRLPAPKTPSPSTAKTGFDLAKKGVNLAASFDMFDVVKGYLIGEGYADTEEAALAIMINMSEEWKQSIIVEARAEGVGPYIKQNLKTLPPAKPLSGERGDGSGYGDKFTQDTDAKSFKPGVTVPKVKKFGRISRIIPHGIGDHATPTQSRVSVIVRKDPGAPTSQKLPPPDKKKPSREIVRKNKDTNESYNIILSYLLDEGYANSVEAAESIMVSMSEDWVLSIIG